MSRQEKSSQTLASRRLARLLPSVGTWTSAALWHGFADHPVPPTTQLSNELSAIGNQRLAGLVLRYIRDNNVSVAPAEEQWLRDANFAWICRAQAVTASAVEVVRLLNAKSIPCAVSKGPSIARLYDSLDCRPYSDVDILLAPEHFKRAERILTSRGWAEEAKNLQPWAFFGRWCREGLNLGRAPHESIDLHHRLPPWRWSAKISTNELIKRSKQVTVGGAELPCISTADNLLVVALHVVSDRNAPGKTLMVWRDLAGLAAKVSVEEAVDRAVESGLAGWLRALLLALPESARPLSLIDALPISALPSPHRLNLLLSEHGGRLGVSGTQFLRLPLPNGLAYLAGMAFPSRNFVIRKYPDARYPYLAWWTSGLASGTK